MKNLRKALLRPAFITCILTTGIQQTFAQPAWQSNEHITRLPKIELGTWEVPDTVKIQWADKDGNTTFHHYPSCFLLDLKDGVDVTTGKGYVVKDMADMFGPEGLLKDQNDNLDRLMESPIMTGTKLVYQATGGPVDVDFMFGSGGFGNRLCYYYIPAEAAVDQTTLSMVKAFSENEIPTFCITDQMRASVHMERYKKENGEWKMLPKGNGEGEHAFGNNQLGEVLAMDNNYGGWGDDLVTGKRFRLKYFGPAYDQAPSDDFPAGTRIYFFLATYDSFDWAGGTGDNQTLPFSVKFAYRSLNREFGVQGKWDYLNCPAHKEKYDTYGPGIFAAAAVNFTYTDSDKGTLENINFMTWEDWTQPIGNATGDFDMGDVGFGLYGVKNPLFDVISESKINLQVIQEVKDFQDGFEAPGKGAHKNAYRYKFVLKNGDGDDADNKVYSRGLQPVTFTCTDEATGEGRFNPSYTWASIRRFTDDSQIGEVVKYVVIRKTASLPDNRKPKVEDLNNPDLVYRIDYAMATHYDEDNLPAIWDGRWYYPEGDKLYFEHRRGTENDKNPLPLEKMTSLYHDAIETLNKDNEYINKKKFWMMFAFRDGIRVKTNEDAVASPRASFVIEPRGTLDQIDLMDDPTKHLESLDRLSTIDNRTFFTITYNPQTDLFGKEHISALFIVNDEGRRFCKIRYNQEEEKWETVAENTSHPDNQHFMFEIVRVIDQDATHRHFVVSTNLVPEKDFGIMVETRRDLYPAGFPVIDYNTFGVCPDRCAMPSLSFDNVEITPLGQRPPTAQNSDPYVFLADTRWSLQGLDNPSEVIFSQWRSYNNKINMWHDTDEDNAYLNILHNNVAATGTIPGEDYTAWLAEAFNDADNQLIATDGATWANHDVLAQKYDGMSAIAADYILRAYIPSWPAILNDASAQNVMSRDAGQNPAYVVLEARKSAGSRQSPVSTGIENVGIDSVTEPLYYNLQGHRVTNPVAGEPYITVRGTAVAKQIYR